MFRKRFKYVWKLLGMLFCLDRPWSIRPSIRIEISSEPAVQRRFQFPFILGGNQTYYWGFSQISTELVHPLGLNNANTQGRNQLIRNPIPRFFSRLISPWLYEWKAHVGCKPALYILQSPLLAAPWQENISVLGYFINPFCGGDREATLFSSLTNTSFPNCVFVSYLKIADFQISEKNFWYLPFFFSTVLSHRNFYMCPHIAIFLCETYLFWHRKKTMTFSRLFICLFSIPSFQSSRFLIPLRVFTHEFRYFMRILFTIHTCFFLFQNKIQFPWDNLWYLWINTRFL